MTKKKYFGLLFTLLLVFCLGLFCTSYAAPSVLDLISDLRILESKAGLGASLADNLVANNSSWTRDIYYDFNRSDFKGYALLHISSSSSYYANRFIILLSTNSVVYNRTNDTHNTLYYNWGTGNTGGYNFNFSTGGYSSGGSFELNRATFDYAYTNNISISTRSLTLGANEEYGAHYIISAIDFTQFGDVMGVTVNNYTDVNVIYYNPTRNIYWGRIENYNDLETSKLTIGLAKELPNGDEEVLLNEIVYELEDLGRYYISTLSRLVYTNRLYKLFIDYDGSLETYYYFILPYGSNISSGQTITYTYTSGDSVYDIQNSTNDIINNQKSGDKDLIGALTDDSEVDNIMNEYLSGDIEDIANEFGFTPLDNPFTTFLLHIVDGLYDALTVRDNVQLSADYKTMHFVLNSNDFQLPESSLRFFIRNVLIFFYIYGNYRFYHYLITLFETARIDKAMAELGHDEFYDSDIM